MIEILRAELEQLFDLDELLSLCRDTLGFDPEAVGGSGATGSFVKSLTDYCVQRGAIEALCDAVLCTNENASPQIAAIAANGVANDEAVPDGTSLDDYQIVRKLGEGRIGASYHAQREGRELRLKILRSDVRRHRVELNRFMVTTRLLRRIEHASLPTPVAVGEVAGRLCVVHSYVDGQPLAERIGRGGPVHINEARPVLDAILDVLMSLHLRHLAHGDLHLDNVLLARSADGTPLVVLLDAGTNRLHARPRVVAGSTDELAMTVCSPKTAAPELLRGLGADPRSDVYSFGAVLYEIITGRPVFGAVTAAEHAVGHLGRDPALPSSVAPRGWVSRELDEFVLRLLAKDPDRRPADASVVIDELEALGRSAVARREVTISNEEFDARMEAVLSAPADDEAAVSLEAAVDAGAHPRLVADTFCIAADHLTGEEPDWATAKKRLWFRAARLFESATDLAQAEQVYVQILDLDPSDDVALAALETTRRRLGKFNDVVEMLLKRSEAAQSRGERARAFAEIGKIYAQDMQDREQALVAYAQSYCEDPHEASYVREIEKLAGSEQKSWEEVLGACVQATSDEGLPEEEKNSIYCTMAAWYTERVSRPDLAVAVYQAVLSTDPGSSVALDGLIQIYRKAQQWMELGATLLRRADVSATPAQARDLRAEAADLLETQLNDAGRARDLYEKILEEDPGHKQATEALGRIYERIGDHAGRVKIFERQADAQQGDARARNLFRIAEVFEDELTDDAEAVRRLEVTLREFPEYLDALLAQDRLYSKAGRYTELVDNLRVQVRLAATPRQKIRLWERIAGICDEEFLDHAKAAEAWEATLEIDTAYEPALVALPRHYRALNRWEEVASVYERHVKLISDEARRLELTLARATVLETEIGALDRAILAYDAAVAIDPHHAGALDALARLRASAGDATAALDAILTLAEQAETPRAKAEQYFRAAHMLEERGDLDRAIDHYKLALDQVPEEPTTAEALRRAYLARGDVSAAIQLLDREFERTEGDATKARLAAEVAVLAYERLKDDKRAEEAAKRAVSHDPTNIDALGVLGDLAFEDQRYLEATKHFEQVAGNADKLDKDRATRVLVRYVDSLSQAGSTEQALAPMDTLLRIAPDNADALGRVAQVTFEHGSIKRAAELYRDLFTRFAGRFHKDAKALYRYGEALRRTGELDAAIEPLEEASDVDPTTPLPLIALAKVYEDKANWDRVLRVKGRHIDIANTDERVQLLIEIGDIASSKLNDRARATKSYVAALEDRPEDRRLLTKLMVLYGEEQDWEKLIDVVLRLADFVDDPQQRAKYLMTAAMVCSRQTGDMDEALLLLERVLDSDPGNEKAIAESIQINRDRGDFDRVEEFLKRRLTHATGRDDKETMLDTFLQLGELYERDLGWMDKAIDAYEAAQTLDPDNEERTEMLSQLYASEPEKYLDKAVAIQIEYLRRDPYQPEPYKNLRRMFTETKSIDPAWCVCQVLSLLNLAEPEEERFFKRMQTESAAPARSALSDEDWINLLLHPETDPLLTSIFGLIEPAIIGKRSRSLQELGYDPQHQVDLAQHPYPMSQTLNYTCGVLGMDVPPAYHNPNDPGGLSFLHSHTPSIVLGKAAMATEIPAQAAAFIAARHLAYYRPGMYVRHLIASGTGLKAWLFAAIKLIAPQFPIAAELEGPVREGYAALDTGVTGKSRDHLARIVAKLVQGGASLDLKRWVRGVDLTADRVGFVVGHDLGTALEIVKASDETSSSVTEEERRRELILYAVSPSYFELRNKLSITVDV